MKYLKLKIFRACKTATYYRLHVFLDYVDFGMYMSKIKAKKSFKIKKSIIIL